MLYRVKIKPTTGFDITISLNIQIYNLIRKLTNDICEIEYDTLFPLMFTDLHTNIKHDLTSFNKHFSKLFMNFELDSFPVVPVRAATISDPEYKFSDKELLEHFLEKYDLTRDKVRQQIINAQKRKVLEAKIRELEKEYNEIGM